MNVRRCVPPERASGIGVVFAVPGRCAVAGRVREAKAAGRHCICEARTSAVGGISLCPSIPCSLENVKAFTFLRAPTIIIAQLHGEFVLPSHPHSLSASVDFPMQWCCRKVPLFIWRLITRRKTATPTLVCMRLREIVPPLSLYYNVDARSLA